MQNLLLEGEHPGCEAGQIEAVGEVLRRFNESYVHQYPHIGNFGVIPRRSGPPKFIVRDLEAAIPLRSLNPRQRFAYLLHDLLTLMGRLDDGAFDWSNQLLAGYFNHVFPDHSFPFMADPALLEGYRTELKFVKEYKFKDDGDLRARLDILAASTGHEKFFRFISHYFDTVSSDKHLGVYPPAPAGSPIPAMRLAM